MMTLQNAAGLLQQFAGKSKGAALAVIAISKGLHIAQTIQATGAAVMRAYSDLGPIAGSAAAVGIKALGAANVALIAATGLVEARNIGGGPTPVGTYPASPITGLPAAPSSTAPAPQAAVQVIVRIEGPVYGTQEFVRGELIPALRDAIDNSDAIIMGSNSRQAADLRS